MTALAAEGRRSWRLCRPTCPAAPGWRPARSGRCTGPSRAQQL